MACVCVFLQVRLEWPTDLAINPLDNSLYILDNNIVLQVLKTHTQHVYQCMNSDSLRDIGTIYSRGRRSNEIILINNSAFT